MKHDGPDILESMPELASTTTDATESDAPTVQRILASRPSIGAVHRYSGTFLRYSGQLFEQTPPARSARLKKIILDESAKLLRPSIDPAKLAAQLSSTPILSTADHAGMLNLNILYNANLLYSRMLRSVEAPYLVVLATGRTPLDNISHPRGFYFKNTKHNFFPRKEYRSPVGLLQSGIRGADATGIDSILRPGTTQNLTTAEHEFLERLFFDSLQMREICADGEPYIDQLPRINQRLWKLYFDEEIRQGQAEMVYLHLDKIVTRLVIEDLANPASLLSSILLDKQYRQVFLEQLTGVPGCWWHGYGSQFFWGVGPKTTLVPLEVRGQQLVGPENSGICVDLEAGALAEALGQRRIVPGYFLDVFMLSFVEGYTLLGGFNQIEYVQAMQEAVGRSLTMLGQTSSAAQSRTYFRNGFICGPAPFGKGSGIDLLWERNSKDGKFLGNLRRAVTEAELSAAENMPMRLLVESGADLMSKIINP